MSKAINIAPSSSLLAALHSKTLATTWVPKEIRVLQTIVAGTAYTNVNKFEKDLQPNCMLELVREPKNKFDTFAIRLDYKKKKIGYIPSDKNEVIANLLDAGKGFTCKLVEKELEGSWLRLEIDVYLKD